MNTPDAPLTDRDPVILNLADPADVRRSSALDGPVYWVAPEPPERLCGPLAGDVQGAWVMAARIRVRIPGRTLEFELPAAPGADPVALASLALERALAGTDPEAIRREIEACCESAVLA